ncbi:hypothetical protein F4818DRAFT_396558 [Hypoxylon cercidicola]|nr:hypothetical protein F4818DRAFT_396558 [Hypoxylon cercidicola]
MIHSNKISFALTATISLLPYCLSSPTILGPGHAISRRLISGYHDCDDGQRKKLGQDFADAANFALHAIDMDNTKEAFTHYFRTSGDGKSEDWNNAKSIWDTIQQDNDPTNAPFVFSVRCAKADDQECGDKASLSFAITDARPQDGDTPREMKICPDFFTHASTKQSTTSHPYKPNPGRRDDSWCKPGTKFSGFSVGGLTLLHEMTHLDAVAKAAGYPEVDDPAGFKSHGTEDISGLKPDNDPVQQARNLAKLWQDGKQSDQTLKPFRNAESLAASALEWYVMKFCEIGEIDN